MKKIGDIMAEMGFRKDASDSVKEAFLKHLIKNATGVEVETPSEKKKSAQKSNRPKSVLFRDETHPTEPEQLSFDFGDTNPKKTAKVS